MDVDSVAKYISLMNQCFTLCNTFWSLAMLLMIKLGWLKPKPKPEGNSAPLEFLTVILLGFGGGAVFLFASLFICIGTAAYMGYRLYQMSMTGGFAFGSIPIHLSQATILTAGIGLITTIIAFATNNKRRALAFVTGSLVGVVIGTLSGLSVIHAWL